MNRRVQKTTTGTFFITLPKDWVKEYDIKHGATLEIEIRRDGALIIYPPHGGYESRLDKVTVLYSKGQLSTLKDFILGAYLLGYSMIDVIAKEGAIDPKDREEIRRMVHSFIGLEVLDEDERRMSIRSILDPLYTDPIKLLNRMAYLVEDMLRDGFKAILNGDLKLANIVAQRDDEVDRVYFLLIRLLRGALRNPSLADKYMLSLVDYLDYRVAAKIIETIGDIASSLQPYIDRPIHDEDVKEVFDKMIDIYRFSIEVFFTKETKKRLQLMKMIRELSAKLETTKKRKRNLYDLIRWLITESIDIADLAITIPPK